MRIQAAKEQQLMLSTIHTLQMASVRGQLGGGQRGGPSAWLPQQRQTVRFHSLCSSPSDLAYNQA